MNKIIIPSILVVALLVAGMFALIPVEKASTVHTTIQSSLFIKDVFVDATAAGSANNNPITADFLVVKHDGTTVTGLTVSSFTTSFIAGTTSPGAVTITEPNSGSGGYRLTIKPTANWVAGRTDIVLTATSGSLSGSTLLVVNIV